MSDSAEFFTQSNLLKYVHATWDPQPDITAYELALLLPLFVQGAALTEDKWAELGEATRHLKRSS